MKLALSHLALAFGTAAAAAAQLPLDGLVNNAQFTFANDMQLSAIREDHAYFQHPAFPVRTYLSSIMIPATDLLAPFLAAQSHSLRIKSTTGWCDPDVR
jgi:hypothetical protein